MLRSRSGRRSVAWGAALALVAFALLGTWHHHDSPDPGSSTCHVCKLTTVGAALPESEASPSAPAPETDVLASEGSRAAEAGHDPFSPARAPPAPANA